MLTFFRGSKTLALAAGVALFLSLMVQGQATFPASSVLNLPADGNFWLGAWLDTSPEPWGQDDRPAAFNQRLGWNTSVFQYAQNLPVNGSDLTYSQIQLTQTNAVLYLTIYPKQGTNPPPSTPTAYNISAADITYLVNQCASWNTDGRAVMVRFAPEFNGNWLPHAFQPTAFINLWRTFYTALKAAAPNVLMIWGPNSGNNYPWGGQAGCTASSCTLSAADFALLDTNKDGVLDVGDDAYSPYWPGDAYVDIVALSIYHFGILYPYHDNVIPFAGEFEYILNLFNFYQTYVVQKGKPMIMPETGAAFHVDSASGAGPGEVALKRTWWNQFMFNTTFLALYPKIKLFCLFEFEKIEDDLRDFRISNNSDVLAAFIQDFTPFQSSYIQAGYKAYTPPSNTTVVGSSSTAAPAPSGGSGSASSSTGSGSGSGGTASTGKSNDAIGTGSGILSSIYTAFVVMFGFLF